MHMSHTSSTMTSSDKTVHIVLRHPHHHRRDEDKRRIEDKRGGTHPLQLSMQPVSIYHDGLISYQQVSGHHVFPTKLHRKSSRSAEHRHDSRLHASSTLAPPPGAALPPKTHDAAHIPHATRKTFPPKPHPEEPSKAKRRDKDIRHSPDIDTETTIPSPPPPVLDNLLQRRVIPFRTPSGIDKKKLAIRFDITKNPMDEETRIHLWDTPKGRYVPITLAQWRKPVSPDTVVKDMILHMHHDYSHYVQANLFKRDGLWLNDVFCAIYDMFDRLLNDEDLVKYASLIKTPSFQYWFNERCKGLRNPDQARRLGYKHVDLLQGNVFFADLKHLTFERWIVRVVQDRANELRFGDAYDQ
ncbi:hypothetical protein CPB85DRAFT_539260 [Mucidula mucida]|nr:hypothetical protein CPB85DRAFT_574851 [Mucidula mucida]KAF8875954.1 hypothetical protein CPB85DRAFT_539260 [Mucidula mucida]